MSKPIVIGVGGFARAGKDTFVKIARNILEKKGYTTHKFAFADTLKVELDPFLKHHYGISAWTENTDEKNIIRPIMVAHGCQKRFQTKGMYWVEQVDRLLNHETTKTIDIAFISDCRFPNEVEWVHSRKGWFVHLKKYTYRDAVFEADMRMYDDAPNNEEAYNDPIIEKEADFRLELENAINREYRLTGNKITPDSLIDNTYLNEEIKLCLKNCPLLGLN